MAWLRKEQYLFMCSPNDMVLSGDAAQRSIQMNSWKARGFAPGFPDLFVFEMGSTMRLHPQLRVTNQSARPHGMSVGGLGIELKVGDGTLTDLQQKWCDDLRANGFAYVVARSFDEFVSLVRAHHGHGVPAMTGLGPRSGCQAVV